MQHTLLLVEDDEDMRDLMQGALERKGYNVVTAGDGKEALSALSRIEGLPCLVLLDLMMPGMNGWDFFSELKSRPELAGVPVVIQSSASPTPDGADSVLRKPCNLERLLSVVEEFCEA